MPLDLKLKVSVANDCGDLLITDNTGDYSDNNSGGWGGFNASPTSGTLVLVTTMLIEVYISPTETRILDVVVNNASITIVESSLIQTLGNNSGEFVTPLENSLKNFTLKVNAQNILGSLLSQLNINGAYGITAEEGDFATADIVAATGYGAASGHPYMEPFNFAVYVKDSIFKVTPTYINEQGDQFAGETIKFNNVCLTQKMVDELATSVDFRCEDCDDRDVDQISLAYSLLEALKHI
tara:strand:+ start:284 stop:997 length:714 start_codon:yes stop_codon:yes gene_type:complete